MDTHLRTSHPKARKDHDCMACARIKDSGIGISDMTLSGAIAWCKAMDNGFKIKKGDTYISSVSVYDGVICAFKAIPEIHQICVNQHLYHD